jgi:hypothetical protein
MPKHRGSLAAQHLLMRCTLMLLLARSVEPAHRGFMSPAPAPTARPASPAPSTRHFTWDVEYILWAPDCRQHGMIGINGTFPGPTITANAGDRIVVVVNNHLHTEGVVIHWHGIRQVTHLNLKPPLSLPLMHGMTDREWTVQIGTPWADGTASISQCAINPGDSFTYNFTADKVCSNRSFFFSFPFFTGRVFFQINFGSVSVTHRKNIVVSFKKKSRCRQGPSSTTGILGCRGRQGCTGRSS